MSTEQGYSPRTHRLLLDEAGDSPWVLGLLIEREMVLDEIIEAGAGMPQSELRGTFQQAAATAELAKLLMAEELPLEPHQ